MKMKRQEFLFLYESINANANGDPLNDNRPRIDDEDGKQFVTRYRIKRTIRDYLKLKQILDQSETNQVLYKRIKKENDKQEMVNLSLSEMLDKYTDFSLDSILKNFIDIRLFGGVLAFKNKAKNKEESIHIYGPVQVNHGKSLHCVTEQYHKLSPSIPHKEGTKAGTFGDEYIVPYGLIGVDGSVNQFNADKTNLTDDDLESFYDSIWNGTNDLSSTSKNQKSLFMVKIIFNDKGQLKNIGHLNNYLSLEHEQEEEGLRSTRDYAVSLDGLANKLNNMSDFIESIEVTKDDSLSITHDSKVVENFSSIFKNKVITKEY